MTSIFGTVNEDYLISTSDASSVYGYSGDDEITNNFNNTALYGNNDNDTIISAGSNNLLSGGKGDDILDAAFGINNELYGNSGNDYLDNETSNSSMYGGSGNDTIVSMSSFSLLSGGSGNDVLHVYNEFDEYYYEDEPFDEFGVEENDDCFFIPIIKNTVEGGSGNDIIYSDLFVSDSLFKGGSGNDFIVLEEAQYNTAEGGSGNDLLVALSSGGNFYGESGDDMLLRLGEESLYGDDDFLPFEDDFAPLGSGSTLNYAGPNNIDDTLEPVLPNWGLLSGGSGNDVLLSLSAIGGVEGNSGNDLLIGALGFGYLDGGSDADVLLAVAGEFGLSGGSGNDIMLDIFNDSLNRSGGSGNDVMLTALGTGSASGGQGEDVILAGLGEYYSINGNSSNDVILGVALSDSTLEGSSGNDALLDAIGGNTLSGGSGEDILVAGLGNGLFDTYETLFDEGGILESVGDKAISLYNEVITTYQPILGDFADTIDEQFVNAIDLLEVAGDNNPGNNSMISGAEEGLSNFIGDIGGGLQYILSELSVFDLEALIDTIDSDDIESFFDNIDLPASDDSYLIGGTGNDIFVFLGNDGHDTINHFDGAGVAEGDLIAITHTVHNTVADVLAATSYSGDDAIVDMGIGHSITVNNVGLNALTAEDFMII